VSWGEEHGADARRLVAMLCRRGRIRGTDIGAIRVQKHASEVDIAGNVASVFQAATRAPDPRDPLVTIAPLRRAHASARPGFEPRAARAKGRERGGR
jgi:ATP-dependent RNA helicase DeaD